ncbi:MAG: pilus assembly protein N-terminal domain-containing protein [Bryobacteraceae bacterium]|nr:pilus assembly protein N-terminal domain-containing protein [Bryobacteraceae bacterium]
MMALLLAAAMTAADATSPTLPAHKSDLTIADLRMTVGRSLLIDYPAPIRQISTSDPAVVDAVGATVQEFLLHGKAHGTATVVVWARDGRRTLYNVTVDHNVEPIRTLMKETFPGEPIEIRAARDEVTLIGRVSSKEVADRATALAAPLAKTVVNNLQIAAPPVAKQILLRVKFAELNRNAGQSFAVNLVPTGTGNTIGRVTTGQFSPPTVAIEDGQTKVTISDALNIFAFRPDLNLMTFVRALQNQGLLQILAEPNLVTTAGKEASFLVGGEFPVPVVQGGANAGAITITFREFGVRLTFNPTLTEHGTIKLYVKPEVNTLDLANAVSISGFTIPALATRRVETNIELAQGQSFVIGGLIDDRVTENLSRIPGLAAIPVLGTIFKSRNESRAKTELVVLVTPEIANPLEPGAPLPLPVMPKETLPPATPAKIALDPAKPKEKKAAKTAVAQGKPAPSPKPAPAATAVPAPVPAPRPEKPRRESGLTAVPGGSR